MLLVPWGYKWLLTRTIYSGLGFAYPMVDPNTPCTIKRLEQKILYQWLQSHISLDQSTHFHIQSNDLIENGNGLWKHLLSNKGGAWLICSHYCVVTFNKREAKEGSPLNIVLYFSREEGAGARCCYDYTFFFRTILFLLSHDINFLFFLPDAAVLGSGLQLCMAEAGWSLSRNY